MQFLASAQGEFDEYPDTIEMHGTARLAEMLNKYSEEIRKDNASEKFLLEEIKVLDETKGIGLPNFLPKAAFLTLLQRRVNGISAIPVDFVEKIWSYVESVIVSFLLKHSSNYPQLVSCTRRAAKNLIAKKQQQSVDWVNDIVEMEKLSDYTCNTEYLTLWNKLMSLDFAQKRNKLKKSIKLLKESKDVVANI